MRIRPTDRGGRFPLFTDENVDGPILRGLRQRRWDVQHATEEFGEKTTDTPLLEHATELGRVLVSTDKDMLRIAKQWAQEGRLLSLVFSAKREGELFDGPRGSMR